MTRSADNITAEKLTTEEYLARHKRAFRVAFDFLNAHFPPLHATDWWDMTANDLAKIGRENEDNPLLVELIIGIYNYLEKEEKVLRISNAPATEQEKMPI